MAIHQQNYREGLLYHLSLRYGVCTKATRGMQGTHRITNAGSTTQTDTETKKKETHERAGKRLTARVGVKLNRPYIPLNEPELWKLCH